MHPPRPMPSRDAPITLLSALAASLWIAICAAAPEFLWRGLHLAGAHLTRADLLSALMIGLILAFFVEPLMERIRHFVNRHERSEPPEGHQRSALFTAAISIAFALASVALHDVMLAFMKGPGQQATPVSSYLTLALEIAVAWAAVPFAVTLAWLGAGVRWVGIPLGVIALLSPVLAGWAFDWGANGILTTFIPCALILGLGYRDAARGAHGRGHGRRYARSVAIAALVWLVAAAIVDAGADLAHAPQFRLYDQPDFWVDARFYLGWVLGLLVAPLPARAAKAA